MSDILSTPESLEVSKCEERSLRADLVLVEGKPDSAIGAEIADELTEEEKDAEIESELETCGING